MQNLMDRINSIEKDFKEFNKDVADIIILFVQFFQAIPTYQLIIRFD